MKNGPPFAPVSPYPGTEEQTYYEILEVDPGASEEEVRRAHKRVRLIYSRDSMVVYTLFTEDELERLHQKIEEAYDTIIDPRKRREYDLARLETPGVDAARSADDEAPPNRLSQPGLSSEVPTDLPPDIDISDSTLFSGDLLQRIREHKGVDLRDLSDRTKISLMNLRYIEDKQYADLPAPVYIRGFLKEYARYLKLPLLQVVETYMAMYEEQQRSDLGEEEL